jgi:prophage DNA circulation protein
VSWKDNLLEAKFRNVPFFVQSARRTGGRRLVAHDYPFSESPPFHEDMGIKGRSFPIIGYVLGADYFLARNRLIEALETEIPGELVHPYYKVRRVAVEEFEFEETAAEGGIVRFSIKFVETSTAAGPKTVPDAKAAVNVSAIIAQSKAIEEYARRFRPVTLLQTTVLAALRGATRAIDTLLGKVAMETQQLAAIAAQVNALESSAAALLEVPDSLTASMLELVESFGDGIAGSATAPNPTRTFLSLYDFDPGTPPPASTPNREVELENFSVLRQTVQRLVIVKAARMAIAQSFASFDDAVTTRSLITDLIDEQVETASDETYPTLDQLRADLVKALPGEDSDLPRLIAHTPVVTLPALVVAHNLYGHLNLTDDLVDRNRFRHPGFVPGGVELEVLTDG